MRELLAVLFGAAFCVAVSFALGQVLISRLRLRLYREERRLLGFVLGAACLSELVFLLAATGLARRGVFLALGIAALAAGYWACRRRRQDEKRLPPLPVFWRWLFGIVVLAFGTFYLVNALAPEYSPDGSYYHLGLVSRYLRAHGFERITTNMYANLSEGIELLYLFAFAFGRHSAAALVHFTFLVTLARLMVSYGRRSGFGAAGAGGALLFFASPVAGMDGTTAYIDVATACVLFAVFYLLQIWREEPDRGLLIAIGLVSGFAYAAKYTAFVALPYALGMVAWRCWRHKQPIVKPLLLVSTCAMLLIAPWMVKNWVWLDNPFSPFLNSLFPNPYIHISFEKEYAYHMRHYDRVASAWQIPLEVTMRGGALVGFVGPIFLLAPLALLALRSPAGRQILLAALVFGATYAANIGTRFLLPALPFVSLAMALVAASWKPIAPALAAVHAVLCWPTVTPRYCAPTAWRLAKFPRRAALRIESEDSFLGFRMPQYRTARMIERLVPPGDRVFCFTEAPAAYTSRELVVAYQSALGNVLGDILWTPLIPDFIPGWRLRFRFPAQPLRRIRVVQTASGEPDQWSVSELRVFQGGDELQRRPKWRLRARPNPWDVQFAFDNSPVTRWRSWQTLYPGMFLSVDFNRAEMIDSVLLECSHDQYKIRLKLEGQDAAGNWKLLAEAPEASNHELDLALRRVATAELKARGIDYLLIFDSDYGAKDFRTRMNAWGITLLGENYGARLYRLE